MIEFFNLINVLLSSDSDGNILALLLAGPAAGYFFYSHKLRRYRNFDKTHQFEAETKVQIADLESNTISMGIRKRLRNSKIIGRNDHNSRKRVEEIQLKSLEQPEAG